MATNVGKRVATKLGNMAMTSVRRAAEFPGNYYRASGDSTMFCDVCNIAVDW